jgi:hypothetical protein
VPKISGKLYRDDIYVAIDLRRDGLPSAIGRTVIDQDEFVSLADCCGGAFTAASNQFLQSHFLVEAWNDY